MKTTVEKTEQFYKISGSDHQGTYDLFIGHEGEMVHIARPERMIPLKVYGSKSLEIAKAFTKEPPVDVYVNIRDCEIRSALKSAVVKLFYKETPVKTALAHCPDYFFQSEETKELNLADDFPIFLKALAGSESHGFDTSMDQPATYSGREAINLERAYYAGATAVVGSIKAHNRESSKKLEALKRDGVRVNEDFYEGLIKQYEQIEMLSNSIILQVEDFIKKNSA